MKRALVVGCGLSGAVIARHLAEHDYNVHIMERRNHIGGNMYDYVDDHGILVHKYGPHTFHTNKKKLFDYMCRFAEWEEFYLTCGAEINGICTPTPFNFQTIDDFYSPEEADLLKQELTQEFSGRDTVTVIEALNSSNALISNYAHFLFDNDYSLYSAKQWGIPATEIDPSILERVPLRLSYDTGYFNDKYQVMPQISYTSFFENILRHPNIAIELGVDALDRIRIVNNQVVYQDTSIDFPVVYTGPIDELFGCCYGHLPYRSLRFEWIHEDKESKQNMPVVAYPQAPDFIRIVEYKKLPIQAVSGTTYEVEYSLPYQKGVKNEPYYPLLTEQSKTLYARYSALSQSIHNLYICGRLGDFKYYNMDRALERALEICQMISPQ